MIHSLTKARQSPDALTLVFTGDVILDVPEPDHWLAGIAPALHSADIAIGHLEVPHTYSKSEMTGDVPAPGADPMHLAALPRAGFTAMTLAGNHIADCGANGIADTVNFLQQAGIAYTGAGAELASARKPCVIEAAKGRRIGMLSYNCVGPATAWATLETAGCAYLPVATLNNAPIAPAATFTSALPEAAAILRDDIAALRQYTQLIIVALHKGTVHTPARIENYERELAHMAIDAGADIVVSHHAHIVRGIEFYRGKPIYHGLGNGCVVTRALSPDQTHPARAAWAERRKQLFGFEPDPAFELAPFHPEAVNAFMAKILWRNSGELECGIVPLRVDAPGRPRLAAGSEVRSVCDYLQHITLAAGLPALNLEIRATMVAFL